MVLSKEFGTKQEDIAQHFVAVSHMEKVTEFGINPDNVFQCGIGLAVFSLWSAVGLTISLAIGFDNFDELLSGADEMDDHFKTADFDQNMPVVCLLSIWYNNFFGAESEALIPTQYQKTGSLFTARNNGE
jgi:glucose-6-phosphate isomerase